MLLTTAVLVLVFGGLTLYLHDAHLHQVEADDRELAVRRGVPRQPFPARADGHPAHARRERDTRSADWSKLSLAWVAFFVLSGALNLYVAYHYPEATWVNFKLFGLMGLTLAFRRRAGHSGSPARPDRPRTEKT